MKTEGSVTILRHVSNPKKAIKAYYHEVSPLRSYWTDKDGKRLCQVGLEGLKGFYLSAPDRRNGTRMKDI